MDAAIRDAERERIRTDWVNEPGFYNPWLHLGVTTVTGGMIIAVAIALLHELRWSEVALGFGLLIFANAFEWRVHRDALHKRFAPAAILYEMHTPRHHRIFLTEEMSIRGAREFRLVLMPAYAIVLSFFGLCPVMALLWWCGWHNLACVFAIVTMGYVVSYELLHLSYHLPPDSWIGRRSLIAKLKRHHAIHHDPKLMQKWNFNVTVPLWDLVRRTYRTTPSE